MYIDNFSLEGAWIVDDQTQIGGYQELVARVLELVDAGYSFWEWYHIQLVGLIIYGEASIYCCQEDVIAHFSNPLERDGGTEMMMVDGSSLVGEDPFAFFLVRPYMPYVSASESVLSYLEDFWIHSISDESMDTYQIIAILGSYPSVASFDRVNLIYF